MIMIIASARVHRNTLGQEATSMAQDRMDDISARPELDFRASEETGRN